MEDRRSGESEALFKYSFLHACLILFSSIAAGDLHTFQHTFLLLFSSIAAGVRQEWIGVDRSLRLLLGWGVLVLGN